MRAALVGLLLAVMLAAPVAAEAPSRPPQLDYNRYSLPDSSLIDFSSLLEAPAGKRGVLTARNGHFWFADGTRARFWGVNVAKEAVFAPHELVDRAVEVFARAGINMVRLHHVDDRQGVLRSDGKLHPDRMASLDYWVWRLKERGIYVYLDLLDYRTFQEAEGVPKASKLGRGAKPYAVFNSRLIELQKRYAKQLLVDHVNRYTHLPYGKDPAVAIIELFDENGLFSKPDWPALAEPYRSNLQSSWNRWLRRRYGATAQLAKAWTNSGGSSALAKGESLERGTVSLPRMTLESAPVLSYSDRLRAAARRNDGARFAAQVQQLYYRQMRDYLRGLGVLAPLTATVTMDQAPDLQAVAAELDATAINFYWDHPAFGAGAEWRSAGQFSLNNPLAGMPTSGFGPAVAAGRVWGKPVIVREWSYCYPNPYRAAGMMEAAAYGAMLDVDVMLLFTYQPGDGERGITYFDVRTDPARWSMVGIGAHAVLGQGIRPSSRRLAVMYHDRDAFNYYRYEHPAHRLAWLLPVGMSPPGAPLVETTLGVAAGRSAGLSYRGTDSVLFWNERNVDTGYRMLDDRPERRSGYTVASAGPVSGLFTYSGVGFGMGQRVRADMRSAFSTTSLAAQHLTPIGVQGNAAAGFFDPKRWNYVFHNLSDRAVLGVTLDALARKGVGNGHQAMESMTFVSDTGELTRDGKRGRLVVNAPTLRAAAGELGPEMLMLGQGVSVSGCPRRGVLAVLSLARAPVETSSALLVSWTDDAENRGQALAPSPPGSSKGVALIRAGSRPVTTNGRACAVPLQVTVAGKPAVQVYMTGGCWQVLLQPGQAIVWCDTPGARIDTPGRAQQQAGG